MESKKILGLDLGIASIGWALVEKKDEKTEIIDWGVEVIESSGEAGDKSSAKKKTEKRQMRRLIARKKQRKKNLIKFLVRHGLISKNVLDNKEELIKFLTALKSDKNFWSTRVKALNDRISIDDLSRILYSFCNKRGSKQIKDENKEFYSLRIKKEVFNEKNKVERKDREVILNEFEKIMETQKKHYDFLTEDFINELRRIIFYERPLKSKKYLKSYCSYLSKIEKKGDKYYYVGPFVINKSNPLFQLFRIVKDLNNLRLIYKNVETKEFYSYSLNFEQKKFLLDLFMNYNNPLKEIDFNTLKVYFDNKEGLQLVKSNFKKIKGHDLLVSLHSILKDKNVNLCNLLKFDVLGDDYIFNKDTGELVSEISSETVENQPLYKLWFLLYSINDEKLIKKNLIEKFSLDEETSSLLINFKINKTEFSNVSYKFIRIALPLMFVKGENDENIGRSIKKETNKDIYLDIPIRKIVNNHTADKIVTRLINLVKEIVSKYVSEEDIKNNNFYINIEFARELSNKNKKNEQTKNNNENKKINEKIESILKNNGYPVTLRNIIKFKLFFENYALYQLKNCDTDIKKNKKSKKDLSLKKELFENFLESNDILNELGMFFYTGDTFSLKNVLDGNFVEIEHIYPISRWYDDSLSNKTLALSNTNKEKGNMIPHEFLGNTDYFNEYLYNMSLLYENNIINEKKYKYLTLPFEKIDGQFINKDLNNTSLIARLSKKILMSITPNINVTMGLVTSKLRNLWNFDEILKEEFIKDFEIENKELKYNKRFDHRNHVIDSLVIALTELSHLQKINKIVNENTNIEEISKMISSRCPLDINYVKNKVKEIKLKHKAKKIIFSINKKYKWENGKKIKLRNMKTLTPRYEINHETIYGLRTIDREIIKFKKNKNEVEENNIIKIIKNVDKIINPDTKKYILELKEKLKDDELVKKYIIDNGIIIKENFEKIDIRDAYIYLKCEPQNVYTYRIKFQEMEFEDIYNIYHYENFKAIEDKVIEKYTEKIKLLENKSEVDKSKLLKDSFKEVVANGIIYKNHKIKNIRVIKNIKELKEIRPKQFVYVSTGYEHFAIYYDPSKKQYKVINVSYNCAIERVKYKIPIIVKNPSEVLDFIEKNNLWDKFKFNQKENFPQRNYVFVNYVKLKDNFIIDNDKFIKITKDTPEYYIKENYNKIYILSSFGAPINIILRKNYLPSKLYDNEKNTKKEIKVVDKNLQNNSDEIKKSLNKLLKENKLFFGMPTTR